MVMGIVNVTPDSFSDGGQFLAPRQLSTMPLLLWRKALRLSTSAESQLAPELNPSPRAKNYAASFPSSKVSSGGSKVPISIDTMKPAVARAALQAGASIVNDVAANREQDEMWRVVAERGAGYVCLHMQGTPATMQAAPHYDDVVAEVRSFFRAADRQNRRLRSYPRATYIGSWNWVWEKIGTQLAVAGQLAELSAVETPLVTWGFTKILCFQFTRHKTCRSFTGSPGLRCPGSGIRCPVTAGP